MILYDQATEAKDKEIEYFKAELESSERFVKELKEQVLHFKDISEDLEHNLGDISYQNEKLKRDLEEKSKCLKEVTKEFKECENKVERHIREKESYEENILKLYTDNISLKEKVQEASEEALNYKENAVTRTPCSTVEVGITKKIENIEELENTIKDLKANNQEKKCRIRELSEEKLDIKEKLRAFEIKMTK